MKRRRVLIELMPTRIDVVLCSGTVPVAARRIDLAPESDPTAWIHALQKAAARLKVAVAELSAEGLTATVLYRSPTQVVDLVSMQARSHQVACSAATLSCLDSLTYSAMAAACEAHVIGRDADGPERRMHTVVAADREDVTGAIVALVEEAGLHFLSATPMEAVILTRLVHESLANRGSRRALLYMGQHRAFFLISEGGALLFGRAIGIGYETLVSGLARLFEAESDDDEHAVQRLHAATVILFRHGFPAPDAIVDETRGLTGRSMIPLMQPILQRLVVELRQSLRFGLSSGRDGEFPIELRGPGGHIPRLAEVVGQELGNEIVGHSEPFNHEEPAARGSVLFDALRELPETYVLNLQPAARAELCRTRRLRTLLWTGAAVALLLVGIDAVHYQLRLDGARGEVKSLASKLEMYESLRRTNDQLLTAVSAMRALEDRIAEGLGARPDHAALLREFGRLVPANIRLTAMTTRNSDEGVAGSLAGYVIGRDGPPDETDLEGFIAALRGSPLFGDVSLDHVQIGTVGEHNGQRFEVKFDVVPTPRTRVAAASAGGGDEGSP